MKLQIVKKRNEKIFITILFVAILFNLTSTMTQFSVIEGISSIPESILWMMQNFVPDVNSFNKIGDIWSRLLETIGISIAATTTGGICALFMSFLGSKVTSVNKPLEFVARTIGTIFRNIPDAVWAMIFLLSFGQNVLTGYFALFFASFGVLTRLFIETIDQVDKEIVEALKSTGASYMHIIFQGVLPSSMGQLISWSLYMVETNIRSSTLIGMLTGTGVGFLFDLYYKSMNYSSAGLVVVLITISILGIELLSNYVRKGIA